MAMHWYTDKYEKENKNTALRIENWIPVASSRKRKGVKLVSKKLIRRKENEEELEELGNLEQVGIDNLHHILTRLDVHSIITCLRVNKTLHKLITSPRFRRSWRGTSGVLVGSRTTLPWYFQSKGESAPSSPLFQPLNEPRCPGEVLASAAGLLCIKHPTKGLAVGNPLTQEWVLVPTPKVKLPDTKTSFRLHVSSGGYFKLAILVRVRWLHRVVVFDSESGLWGVTELHYPTETGAYRWSDYDLAHACWRTNLVRTSGRDINLGVGTILQYLELSHPAKHGFCVWKYKSSNYFSSPWLCLVGLTLSGYGVWKIDDDTGELIPVAILRLHHLDWYENDLKGVFVSCNASESLVCFMGESLVPAALPVASYNIDEDEWQWPRGFEFKPNNNGDWQWRGFQDSCSPRALAEEPEEDWDHYSVGLVYSPSLLAPAATPR